MNDTLSRLNEELGRVDELCVPSDDKAKNLTLLLKQLYDASSNVSAKSHGPLKQLHVAGVDVDTIWEELQTKNKPLKRAIKAKSKQLLTALLHSPQDRKVPASDTESIADAESHLHESDEVSSDFEAADDAESERSSSGSEVPDYDGDENASTGYSEHEEMERWIDEFEELEEKHREKVESREKRGRGHKGAVEEGEEDDFDFVSQTLYDLDDDNDEEGGADIMASEFFGAPASKESTRGDRKSKRKSIRVGNRDRDVGSDGDSINDSGEESVGNDSFVAEESDNAEERKGIFPMSKHQKRLAQIAETVAQLEKEAIGPKNWDMKGEVRGVDRPENSLLELSVDVERASKPAPIVTQEYTNSLEDMILQRVKMGKFDDVIPREIRDKHADYDKDEFMLSQEKSKQGLGDIYADDFMQKSMQLNGSAGAREQEIKDKEEISALFAKVCRQLDALSHFHYAPKPVVAESNITTSAPSIMMEEIGPTAESVVTLSMQAPEEILSHKRGRDAAFISAAELTSDDKKRLRRAAKMVRRKKIREDEVEEKLAAKVNPVLGRKYDAKKADRSIKRDRRVIEGSSIALESDEKVKSFSKSANFFSALQKQSEEEIRRKKEGVKNKHFDGSGGERGITKIGSKSSNLKL